MKKYMCSVIAFAVFATSALASAATDLDVRVPFEFKAGASTLPAGTYRVTEASSGYLLIRGEKGGVFVPRSAFFLDTDEAGRTSVKFSRAGDKYVLQTAPSQK
jgi:hypothetical protein